MNKRGIKREILVVLLVLTLFINVFYVSAGELRVTMEHPFLIDGSWVDASDLVVGDLMATIDGRLARITGIKDVSLKKPISVYNLEASVYHDFVVGDDGLVVHNSNRYVSEFNPDEIYGLPVEEKITLAEQRILNRPLSESQKNAIRRIESEYPGTGRDYLREKVRILKEGGFIDKLDREKLIRSGICGRTAKATCLADDVIETGKSQFLDEIGGELETIKDYKLGRNDVIETDYILARNKILEHRYLMELAEKASEKSYGIHDSGEVYSEIFLIIERWNGGDDLFCFMNSEIELFIKSANKQARFLKYGTSSLDQDISECGKGGFSRHDIIPGKSMGGFEELMRKADSSAAKKIKKAFGEDFDGWVIDRRYNLKSSVESIILDDGKVVVLYDIYDVVIFKHKDGKVGYAIIFEENLKDVRVGEWLFFDDISNVMIIKQNNKYKIIRTYHSIRDSKRSTFSEEDKLISVLYNSRLKKVAVRVGRDGKIGKGSGNTCKYVEHDVLIHDKAKNVVLFKPNNEIRLLIPGNPQHMNINTAYRGNRQLGKVFYDKEKNLLIEFVIKERVPLEYSVKGPYEPDFYTDMLGKRVVVVVDELGTIKTYIDGSKDFIRYELAYKKNQLRGVLYNNRAGIETVSEYTATGNVEHYRTFKLSDKGGFYDPDSNSIFYFENGKWYQTWPQEILGNKPRSMEGRSYRRVYNGELSKNGLVDENDLPVFYDEYGRKMTWSMAWKNFLED